MKKLFKLFSILFIGLALISCQMPNSSEIPEENLPPVENPDPETTDPEITDPEITDPEITDPETTDPEITDPETTGYEVKFEEVETEYWWKGKYCSEITIIDKSNVVDAVLDCIESYKPSFETKTLKKNEEYILEDYNKWIFGNEENPDLKLEVQYFANEELTSSIEPGSVVKNENKTIYVKFIWYLYKDSYTKLVN